MWIHLLDSFDVVTEEGEHLGTWGADETDAFYQFTPHGAEVPLFEDVFHQLLSKRISDWYLANQNDRSADLGSVLV